MKRVLLAIFSVLFLSACVEEMPDKSETIFDDEQHAELDAILDEYQERIDVLRYTPADTEYAKTYLDFDVNVSPAQKDDIRAVAGVMLAKIDELGAEEPELVARLNDGLEIGTFYVDRAQRWHGEFAD